MSELAGELSGACLGADVLARLARARTSGTLEWRRGDAAWRLELCAGRPEGLDEGAGLGRERALVVRAVRAFACAADGAYRLRDDGGAPQGGASLGIDTLGETLVALLTALPDAEALAVVAARAGLTLVKSATFDKLAAIAHKMAGVSVAVPASGATVAELTAGAALPVRRVVIALLALGALGASRAAAPSAAASASVPASPLPAASSSPEHASLLADIERVSAALLDQSHYEVLGVSATASGDDIRKAYLALAKRWHSDAFGGVPLADAAAKVEAIFRRIGEAHQVLSDAAQRQSYDFILARHRQGLPTDAQVILEAEALFNKAQGLVRRGQAGAALPLLQRAVELNKGEPEFFVYLGFALYSAHGAAALEEGRAQIQKGLEINPKLDEAYEFLGRMARVEGQVEEAKQKLKKALELNPKNFEAERELRILVMRGGKSAPEPTLGELVKGLLKRS